MRKERKNVLEAARKHFRKTGMKGVSLLDIASEVGMDIEAMHRHFPKKSTLVFTLLQEELDLVAQKTLENLPKSQLDDQLKYFLKYRFEFFVAHQHSSLQVMREVFFSNEGWREAYETMLWRFSVEVAALFQAAKRRGEIRQNVDETLAARAFVSYYLLGMIMVLRGSVPDTRGICDFTYPLVGALVASLR